MLGDGEIIVILVIGEFGFMIFIVVVVIIEFIMINVLLML